MSQSSSLPAAFVQSMQDLLGTELPAFLAVLNSPSPTSIHVNPLKPINNLPFVDKTVDWHSQGHYLTERPSFTLDPAFHAGAYYVQEAGSMAVAFAARQLSAWDRPLRALDLCAAPGGKSTLLSSILPEGSWLLANEVIRSRYQILRFNLSKWGHPHTFSSQHEVEDFESLAGFFDLVLVDAPCSGEGLFRKDLNARAEWSPEHVAHCAARQKRILATAAKLVAPGGALIYSTCTYNRQENDDNARWLSEETDLSYYPLDVPANWGFEERSFGYQLYPHRVEAEGFYLAAFQKAKEAEAFSGKPAAFQKLQALSRKEQAMATPWIKQAYDVRWYSTTQDNWRGIPAHLLEDAQILATALSRLEVGFPLGRPKGKDLIPAPEWALHCWRSTDLPQYEVDKDTAIHYLRKETPPLPELARGWSLITYQGLGLGWVKGLGNRYNNYFPKEWRIRQVPKK